jgi:N-acetylmuramoyl-L-alanine amidase
MEDISLSERVKRVNKHCDKLGKDNVVLISIHSNAAGNGNKWEKAQGWEAYTSIGSTMSDKLSSIFYKNAELMFPNRRIRYDWTDKDADKEENFYILKNTKCPAILTENFFYDNIDDVNFILSDEGKEKVVELHIKSIIDYLSDEDKTY